MTHSFTLFQATNDAKNALIAFSASTSAWLEALGGEAGYRTVAAVILPIIFFVVGKTIDVLVQLYLGRRRLQKDGKPKESK
ncbi:MAG: hypothetical protein ACK42A_09415 [Pyrinomonadaceae bacterium]|jgi:hypothetical protein